MNNEEPIWSSRGMDRIEWLVLRSLGDGEETQVATIRERLRVALGDDDSTKIEPYLRILMNKEFVLKLPGDTYTVNKEVFLQAYRLLAIACRHAALASLKEPDRFFHEAAHAAVDINKAARTVTGAPDTMASIGILEIALSYWNDLTGSGEQDS